MLRHFYLLSYRVDKTRFSSSGAARDCYVHLHVSPTFQLVFKKFFSVWNAILIYKTLDFFVVNVLPCHVVHDEERKIWTGKFLAAAELESVRVRGKDFTSLVLRLFYLISTPPPPHGIILGGGTGRCVGTFDLQNIPQARGMGKIPGFFLKGERTRN